MKGLRRYLTLRLAEGVELRYELASPAVRLAALWADAAVLSAAAGLLYQLLSPFLSLTHDVGVGLFVLGYFVLSTFYGMLMEWLDGGRTLGKRLMGLRVMDLDGRPLGFYQALLRNLLRIVDRMPLFYGVGGLVAFLHPRWQRLGDLAAGTVVVRERNLAAPDWSVVASERFNSLRANRRVAARLRQRCSSAEAELGLELLQRRSALDDAQRLKLFGALASRFRAKSGEGPDFFEGLSDEQCVRAVVDVLYLAAQDEPKRRKASLP